MWSGDGTSASNSYDMRRDFFDVLEKSGCLKDEKISSNNDFEIDSKAAEFSTFVPKIEKVLGEQSLLKNGTWRFWEMEIQISYHLKDICSGLHLIPIRWELVRKYQY